MGYRIPDYASVIVSPTIDYFPAAPIFPLFGCKRNIRNFGELKILPKNWHYLWGKRGRMKRIRGQVYALELLHFDAIVFRSSFFFLFFFCNQISSRQIDRPFTFHVPHFSSHFSRFELGSIKWREMDLISILSSLILKPFKKLSIDFI